MMNSRERVIAALTFNKPDRTPRDLWTLPYISLFRKDELEVLLDKYPMDIEIINADPEQAQADEKATAQAGAYTDPWGSVWHVAEPGVIGEVRIPILEDWSDLATFSPPWNVLSGRDLSHVKRARETSDKFLLSDISARPFERLQFLRGTENLFIDLGYGKSELYQLLEMVHEFYLEDIRGWCESDVDGIFMMDDWGSNQQLLINPTMWRETFKPLYKEYCDMIHAADKYAFFHSDGNISAIYGDLIEAGFDAINSQLFVMDIEELGRQYQGQVTFWGEIDRQHVLPFGSPEEVRAAVMRVRHALDDESGGVIAQCEWGKDNSQENIETVFKTWLTPLKQG